MASTRSTAMAILSDEFQNTQVEKLGFIPVSKMKK